MAKTKDALGERMKTYYEFIPKTKLMRRCPVALRIDGRAFHTFTKNLKKPFDKILIKSMQSTMQYLCKNIQGCVFGYTQSDEITLILVDYQKLTSSAWFDYEVQKMCSIAASMATLAFNQAFTTFAIIAADQDENDYFGALNKAINKGAMFDCRCFNIPKEEVTNLIYWRQTDASKNSIQMVARAYFSHSELNGKSSSDMQDMLHEKFNVNWNDFPTEQKRGSACIRTEKGWIIDHEMPILKGENRQYVEKLIHFDEEKPNNCIVIEEIDPKTLVQSTSLSPNLKGLRHNTVKKPVDKTKKSNIKCEHCKYWDRKQCVCTLTNKDKNYWNRCKSFEWKE